MEADEKTCPRCAETIKAAAKACRFCGYDFATGAVPEGSAPVQKAGAGAGDQAAGIGCAAVMGIFILIAVMTGGGENSGSESAASVAEDHRKGFHCLSDWDGEHPQLVRALKRTLRDPNSFDHDETRITPVNAQGNHTLIMTYRARNGFGGMNVGAVRARVKNSDCSFEIISATD